MSNTELEEKYRGLLDTGGLFTVLKIQQVNHRPHLFVVGTKHVAYASDHCNGILSEDVCEKIPCDHCREPISKHVSDKALFLRLVRDLGNKEAADALFVIKEQFVKDGIDGVAFIKNGFRIAKPEKPLPGTEEQDKHES